MKFTLPIMLPQNKTNKKVKNAPKLSYSERRKLIPELLPANLKNGLPRQLKAQIRAYIFRRYSDANHIRLRLNLLQDIEDRLSKPISCKRDLDYVVGFFEMLNHPISVDIAKLG